MTEVPDFSRVAAAYAASRPVYPRELYAWLASVAKQRDAAWDAATGNGQAAVGLAERFTHVVATDHSAEQIRHAMAHPRIEYRVAEVERSGLPADSMDLVASAAAIHWFDLPRFYDEVRRVLRDGGVLAAWTYHAAYLEPPVGDVLGPFYRDVVGAYFAPGARKVDARYEDLGLPGEPLDPPAFRISAHWTADQVLRYVRTWSGVQSYIDRNGYDPVVEIEGPVREAMGGGDTAPEIVWPLYVRATRL